MLFKLMFNKLSRNEQEICIICIYFCVLVRKMRLDYEIAKIQNHDVILYFRRYSENITKSMVILEKFIYIYIYTVNLNCRAWFSLRSIRSRAIVPYVHRWSLWQIYAVLIGIQANPRARAEPIRSLPIACTKGNVKP